VVTGFVYAGNKSEWSGAGPFVAPAVTLFVRHASSVHLGIQLKGRYAPLPVGVPSNDQKALYGASLGVAVLID
jgi:hypothetical protein